MLQSLIARYGLIAIFVGAGVEGEPFAIGGGVLAHDRLVPLWAATAAAIAGAFVVDQFWFLLGRGFRSHPRIRAMAARPGFTRALSSFERRPRQFIFLFRYAYGLRIIAPLAIGTSRVSRNQFARVSAMAAIVWSLTYCLIGYLLSKGLTNWISGDVPLLLALVIMLPIARVGVRWVTGALRAARADS